MVKEKEKQLEFGETPFHRMNHEDLLMAAIRMYDAVVASKDALRLASHNDPESSYWTVGTGAIALEKCNQVVDPLNKKYSSENIWRSFYRPYIDLLWKDKGNIILTTHWAVCPVCKNMLGNGNIENQPDLFGKICSEVNPFGAKDCHGVLRPMVIDDIVHT